MSLKKRERERVVKRMRRKSAEEVEKAEERAGANSALLFGRFDFRVTIVMILVAAAGSRSEPSRNVDPRRGDVLMEPRKGIPLNGQIKIDTKVRERKRIRET